MQLSFDVGRVLQAKAWRERLEREERKRQEKLKRERKTKK
jgi:hypothetical protein